MNYNGEVEDCEKDFEETCERNEKTMQDLHGAIDDAAHHETLDELKQQTFDHLDQMAVGYRDHADQMLQIHNRYPGEAQDLIRRETRGYCKDGPGSAERPWVSPCSPSLLSALLFFSLLSAVLSFCRED